MNTLIESIKTLAAGISPLKQSSKIKCDRKDFYVKRKNAIKRNIPAIKVRRCIWSEYCTQVLFRSSNTCSNCEKYFSNISTIALHRCKYKNGAIINVIAKKIMNKIFLFFAIRSKFIKIQAIQEVCCCIYCSNL